MDAAGRRRLYRLLALYDYVVAVACVVAFAVALILGAGAISALFLVVAAGWVAAGRFFARRA